MADTGITKLRSEFPVVPVVATLWPVLTQSDTVATPPYKTSRELATSLFPDVIPTTAGPVIVKAPPYPGRHGLLLSLMHQVVKSPRVKLTLLCLYGLSAFLS